jgi:hypothetical protein
MRDPMLSQHLSQSIQVEQIPLFPTDRSQMAAENTLAAFAGRNDVQRDGRNLLLAKRAQHPGSDKPTTARNQKFLAHT